MGKDTENPPSVSVVIPTWNAADCVERVLEKLVAQEGADFEIVVIDNGVVNDETRRVVERFGQSSPKVRYLAYKKQLGYAGAVNAGTWAASHDLIAVLNNDNLPEPRWLAELVKEWDRAKRAGIDAVISSRVERPATPESLSSALNVFGRYVVPPGGWDRQLFSPDGSAFLFDRRLFGLPYDEEYFIYHEDVYLGWRARLMGCEVRWAPESRAVTFDGGSTKRIAYKTAFYTERNRWLNYFSFLSSSALARLFPALALDLIVKFVFGTNRRAKLHAWLWLLVNPGKIAQKRSRFQRRRKRGDEEVLPYLSGAYFTPKGAGARLVNAVFSAYFRWMRLPLG